jgi:hypothetical protein
MKSLRLASSRDLPPPRRSEIVRCTAPADAELPHLLHILGLMARIHGGSYAINAGGVVHLLPGHGRS